MQPVLPQPLLHCERDGLVHLGFPFPHPDTGTTVWMLVCQKDFFYEAVHVKDTVLLTCLECVWRD